MLHLTCNTPDARAQLKCHEFFPWALDDVQYQIKWGQGKMMMWGVEILDPRGVNKWGCPIFLSFSRGRPKLPEEEERRWRRNSMPMAAMVYRPPSQLRIAVTRLSWSNVDAVVTVSPHSGQRATNSLIASSQ